MRPQLPPMSAESSPIRTAFNVIGLLSSSPAAAIKLSSRRLHSLENRVSMSMIPCTRLCTTVLQANLMILLQKPRMKGGHSSRRRLAVPLPPRRPLKRHVAHARCRRVLAIFRIEHWFACVRHGPVVISFLLFPCALGPLMVHSARLAALSQQSSQVPVEINLTDPDGFSDDMSEDLLSLTMSLFLLPLPPASSVMGTSPLLGLSLAASCSAALCPCTCSNV